MGGILESLKVNLDGCYEMLYMTGLLQVKPIIFAVYTLQYTSIVSTHFIIKKLKKSFLIPQQMKNFYPFNVFNENRYIL